MNDPRAGRVSDSDGGVERSNCHTLNSLVGILVDICSVTIFLTNPTKAVREVVVGHDIFRGLADERASTAGCSRDFGSTAYRLRIGGLIWIEPPGTQNRGRLGPS